MAVAETDVLAVSGGVGGAKLALGLADILPPGRLHVLVNTADDFSHLGLHISPDIDTLVYTLSGRANETQGWGIEGETWQALSALEELGGDAWFKLGDRDLATHLWRTGQMAGGVPLSVFTAAMARRLGIDSHIYPMTDDVVRTTVNTDRGDLPFQHYFVRDRCEPAVTGFSFDGISAAAPNGEVMRLLQQEAFGQIVICPSNPFVSVDPILQLPGLSQALVKAQAPVVVISPIVGGMALKGPAAKMMTELGMRATAVEVARHYCDHYPGLMDYFVIDETDATLAAAIRELGVKVAVAPTVMKNRAHKQELARFTLDLARTD
jgi:LPPG:FO 2-phospho-L-lactate transferase